MPPIPPIPPIPPMPPIPPKLSIAALLLPALPWVWAYLQPGLSLALALMVLPFVWQMRSARPRARYGWLALVWWGLHLGLGNNLWLWLSLGCGLLFAIEWSGRRVGWLPLLLLGLVSPVAGSWLQVFSFPLRLALSQAVADTLRWGGAEVSVAGNRFCVAGQWFEVEAACLGLSSLTVAWVVAVLLLGLAERRRGRRWALWQVAGWMGLATGLGIGANYLRTLGVVLFRSPPGTLGHELLGLLALGMWVVAPLAVGLRLGERRRAEVHASAGEAASPPGGGRAWWPVGVMGLVALTCVWRPGQESSSVSARPLAVAGLTCGQPEGAVQRCYDAQRLFYLKAPTAPWRADHHPQVCWRGSGYRFAHIEGTELAGLPAMQAWLVQGADTLYTAWGYHNGQTATRGGWDWRRRQLGGEAPFFLWNATVAQPKDLVPLLQAVAWEQIGP